MSRCRLLGRDLLICCVGANLDLIGPRDLTEFPDVDLPEKRGVTQGGEHALSYICGQIDHPFHPVRIRDSDTELRQRFDLNGSDHLNKMSGLRGMFKCPIASARLAFDLPG